MFQVGQGLATLNRRDRLGTASPLLTLLPSTGASLQLSALILLLTFVP